VIHVAIVGINHGARNIEAAVRRIMTTDSRVPPSTPLS
jgi:hypothetical protein